MQNALRSRASVCLPALFYRAAINRKLSNYKAQTQNHLQNKKQPFGIITTTTILHTLYRTTCISQHLQLRTGGFCWSKVLLPACHCDGNYHIQIREKMLEFSSTVLPAPSPYHYYTVTTRPYHLESLKNLTASFHPCNVTEDFN